MQLFFVAVFNAVRHGCEYYSSDKSPRHLVYSRCFCLQNEYEHIGKFSDRSF